MEQFGKDNNESERSIAEELGEPNIERLWLEHVIQTLGSRSALGKPLIDQRYGAPYFGKTAQKWGYSYCFEYRFQNHQGTRRYLMISRTHVANTRAQAIKVRPNVGDLVNEFKTEIQRIPREKFGKYHTDLDHPGTYATIECRGSQGRYYFMVSESGRKEPCSQFKYLFQGLG